FPAFTSSASCGASLKLLGNFATSVTTSGPSSLPTRSLPADPAATAYPSSHPDAASTQHATASHHQLSDILRICHDPLMVFPFPAVEDATKVSYVVWNMSLAGAFIARFFHGVNRSLYWVVLSMA